MTHSPSTQIVSLLMTMIPLMTTLWAETGPIDVLTNRADAVVVGEIQSGQQSANSAAFTLLVVRSIKGNLSVNQNLSVRGALSGRDRSLGGQCGLWFLRKAGTQWILLPWTGSGTLLESSGYLPLSKSSSPSAVGATVSPVAVSDQVAIEIATGLRSYSSSLQLSSLTWGLMGLGKGPVVVGLYQSLRGNGDPELKFVGLVGLLGTKDGPSAMAEIGDNLDVAQKLKGRAFVITGICGERNPDPLVVQSLAKISSSTDVNMQRCAAEALDYIHTRDSLPALAMLLDSADPKTREFAIQGLSRFVDNLPIQTVDNTINGGSLISQGPTPYRTSETDRYSLSRGWLREARLSEAEYIQFWKTWWTTMKDRFVTSVP
jgi:hypothetical protein